MLIVYFMQLWGLMPKNQFAFLFDLKNMESGTIRRFLN